VSYDPLSAPNPGRGLAHEESYWTVTAGPEPEDDGPVGEDRECEVAIIGGGYTGLSCAAYLAREFGIRPLVLEANRPGWGCSGRNGSFLRPSLGRLSYSDWVAKWGEPEARRFFAESLAAYRTGRALIQDGGIDCDVQPDGALRLAHRAARVGYLEREHRVLERVFDYPAELLGPEEIAARHFEGREAHAALRTPHSVGLHPLKLVYGLVDLARGAGAGVHPASVVTGWEREAGGHVLATPGGRVRARQVVLATNGYGQEALHPALAGVLLPVLSNIVVTRPMTAEEKAACRFESSDVMYDTRNLLNYYRRLPDDRIMLGCRGPIRQTAASAAAHRAALLDTIKRKWPALAKITADYFWGGWVAITYDKMPHIHVASDDTTVHYALGYCGSGVAAALHAGRRLAERIGGKDTLVPQLDRPLPRFPLAALRRLEQRAAFLWYRLQDEVL
jgi:taurine dehydrogenase large subunit